MVCLITYVGLHVRSFSHSFNHPQRQNSRRQTLSFFRKWRYYWVSLRFPTTTVYNVRRPWQVRLWRHIPTNLGSPRIKVTANTSSAQVCWRAHTLETTVSSIVAPLLFHLHRPPPPRSNTILKNPLYFDSFPASCYTEERGFFHIFLPLAGR